MPGYDARHDFVPKQGVIDFAGLWIGVGPIQKGEQVVVLVGVMTPIFDDPFDKALKIPDATLILTIRSGRQML